MRTELNVRSGLAPVYPLDGVIVVDISRLAITFASRLLTDMGATTVAVHPPARTAERLATPYTNTEDAAERPVNGPATDKLHISLDLKDAAAREVLYGLVRTADVFIEGYRPGVVDRLGCSYEEIREINPDIIYCSITGYGQTGPRASHPGHDINYISVAGAQSLVKTAAGEFAIPLNMIADMAGGVYAAMTVSAALARRNAGHGSSYLDLSLTEGVATLISGILDAASEEQVASEEYFWPRNRRNAMGGRGMLGGGAPFYRIYYCRDGLPVSVGCIEPQFWVALCSVTGLDEFLPHQLVEERWPEMSELFAEVFASRTREEWLHLFDGVDTCVTPVLTPFEAARDEQLAGRKHDGIWAGGRVQAEGALQPRLNPLAVLRDRGCPLAILHQLRKSSGNDAPTTIDL